MGFYIQDDYWRTAQDMSASEQDAYFGALVRRYYTRKDESGRLKKLVRVAYDASAERIDRARDEADRKQKERGQTTGQKPDKSRTKAGQTTGQKPDRANKERESEREIRVSGSNSPSQTPPSLMKGGESGDDVIDRDVPPTAVGQVDDEPIPLDQVPAMCERILEVLSR